MSVLEADEIGEDGISDELRFIVCCLFLFSSSCEWNLLCTDISSSDGLKIGSTDATSNEELGCEVNYLCGLVNRTLTTELRLSIWRDKAVTTLERYTS